MTAAARFYALFAVVKYFGLWHLIIRLFENKNHMGRKYANSECATVTCWSYRTYKSYNPWCATFSAPKPALFSPQNGLSGPARRGFLPSNMAYIALQYGSFRTAIWAVLQNRMPSTAFSRGKNRRIFSGSLISEVLNSCFAMACGAAPGGGAGGARRPVRHQRHCAPLWPAASLPQAVGTAFCCVKKDKRNIIYSFLC